MAFVDNLIDDSVLLSQAKSGKGIRPKKRQDLCSSKQVDVTRKDVHKFEDIHGKAKLLVNKGTKTIKLSSYNAPETNAESSKAKRLSVDDFTGDVITKRVPSHLKNGKSHSTSAHHTKQETVAGMSKGNSNYTETDVAVELQLKENINTKEIESLVQESGDRFKRIIVQSDHSESSDEDPTNDGINFYKTKFIRDEKLEEKKRRIRLMKNRKETDVEKTTKKMTTLNSRGMTPGSDENRHSERPFSEKNQLSKMKLSNVKNAEDQLCKTKLSSIKNEKDQLCKTKLFNVKNEKDQLCKTKLSNVMNETVEKSSSGWKLKQNRADNTNKKNLKSKNHIKSMYKESHTIHGQRVLERFGNIFGYDTDSEDVTLSPKSYCSSVERNSPLNTSSIGRSSLSGDCSPSFSGSSQSDVRGKEKYSNDISTATIVKEKSGTSSTSDNGNVRRRRSSDSSKKSFNSERQNSRTYPSRDGYSGGKGFSNDFERRARRDVSFQSTSLLSGLHEYVPQSSTEISVQPENVIEFNEDDFLGAINRGDSDTLLQLLSLPDISLPSLPFLCLLTEAVQAGHNGVAQVLAALSWGVDAPASHNQDQWESVVETAAAMGDLSLLLVLSTMAGSLVDQTTCAPSALRRGLQMCVQGGAQRCAQQHVLAALNTSLLTF